MIRIYSSSCYLILTKSPKWITSWGSGGKLRFYRLNWFVRPLRLSVTKLSSLSKLMIDNCKLIHHFLFCFCPLMMMKHWSSWEILRFFCTVVVIISVLLTERRGSFESGPLTALQFFAASRAGWPSRQCSSLTSITGNHRYSLHFHDSCSSYSTHRWLKCVIEVTVSIWQPPTVVDSRLSWTYALLWLVLCGWGLPSYIPGSLVWSCGFFVWLHHSLNSTLVNKAILKK